MRLLVVAILFALVAPSTAAHADRRGKVDWSQYLEKPGDRPAARSTPKVAEQKRDKKAKKAPKRAAKKAVRAKRKSGRRR